VPQIGLGLNGARNFVEDRTSAHSLLGRDPLVLNFDARGSAGPALMYETSGWNYELMRHVLSALPRPVFTASSYVTVYNRLPNATDFTVFKRHGWEGLNFAFTGSPPTYHTAEDTLANLDRSDVSTAEGVATERAPRPRAELLHELTGRAGEPFLAGSLPIEVAVGHRHRNVQWRYEYYGSAVTYAVG
jgi:hypothetical protein